MDPSCFSEDQAYREHLQMLTVPFFRICMMMFCQGIALLS